MGTVNQNIMSSIVTTEAYHQMRQSIEDNKKGYQYFLGDIFDDDVSKKKKKMNEYMQEYIAEEWNSGQEGRALNSLLDRFGSQANKAKANAVITKSLRDMRNEALAAEEQLYDSIVNTSYEGDKGKQSTYSRLKESQRVHFWTAVAQGYYNSIDFNKFKPEGLCYTILCANDVRVRAIGKFHMAKAQKSGAAKMMSELTGISIDDKTREQFEQDIMDFYFSDENSKIIADGFVDLIFDSLKLNQDTSYNLRTYIKSSITTTTKGMTYQDLIKKMTKLGETAFLHARAKSNNAFDKVSIRGEDGKVIFTYVAGKGRIASSKEEIKRRNKDIRAKNKQRREENKTLPEGQKRSMLNQLTPRLVFFDGLIGAIKGTTWGQPIKVRIDGADYVIKPNNEWINKAVSFLKSDTVRKKFEKEVGGITDQDLTRSNADALYVSFLYWMRREYPEMYSIVKQSFSDKKNMPDIFSDAENIINRITQDSSQKVIPYFTQKKTITLGDPLSQGNLGSNENSLMDYFGLVKQKTKKQRRDGTNDIQIKSINATERWIRNLIHLLKFISVNEKFITDYGTKCKTKAEIDRTFEQIVDSLVWIYYPAWATSSFGDLGGLLRDPNVPLVFLKKNGMVYPLSQIYKEIYNNFESLSNIDSALSYSTNTTKYKKAYKNMDVSKNLIEGGNLQYKDNFKIKFAGLTISLLNLNLGK